MSPFDRMYKSFALFSSAAAARAPKPFVQMSAGANWMPASPAVLSCLHRELDMALTYRNYGRSAGPRAVTDALEFVESTLASNQGKPAVSITNGSAEGARLVFELLTNEDHLHVGDSVLMVGHGFPLYANLSERFGLKFHEVLGGEDASRSGYLPTVERVMRSIEDAQPKLVFLIVPNNPLGECFDEFELRKIVNACDSVASVLLIDRVCMLPWDDYGSLNRATAVQVEKGRCFIVDSFSKSESLAGLRTGFLVSNRSWRDKLISLTRAWSLNPVVFSTLTLAFSRLAILPDDGTSACDPKDIVGRLAADCAEINHDLDGGSLFGEFRQAYRQAAEQHRHMIAANYAVLCETFNSVALRPLQLDAGFNVAVSLPSMALAQEHSDQLRLANGEGVGVLTEASFRVSKRAAGHYFLRVGLTIPSAQFDEGLKALAQYYSIRS